MGLVRSVKGGMMTNDESKDPMGPIDQDWIRDYVDQIIEVAKTFDDGSAMQLAAMNRANAVMDLVKAWRLRGD